MHAPWAGRDLLEGARVLDAFAGTGALGLEALSRGAATAVFMERDIGALAALRLNIAACRAEARCTVLACDALRPRPGQRCGLVFLDPPYGEGMVPRAVAGLAAAGWVADDALIVAEVGRGDPAPAVSLLADDRRGAARVLAWRFDPGAIPAS